MKQSMQDNVSSIYFNSIQGRKLNFGITKDLDTHNIFLFLITKETEVIGKVLLKEFDCDYMILKFEDPIKGMKKDYYVTDQSNDFNVKEMDMEHFAQSREMKGINSKEKNTLANQHIIILKDEKQGLEQQLKDKEDELKRMTVELDTANKSIYDKERQQKQDKRDITHSENLLRANKSKLNEIVEQLNGKETDLKNAEKDKEQL